MKAEFQMHSSVKFRHVEIQLSAFSILKNSSMNTIVHNVRVLKWETPAYRKFWKLTENVLSFSLSTMF